MIKRGSAKLARKQERTYTTLMHDAIEVIKDPIALAIFTYLQTKHERWIVRRQDVMDRFSIGKDRYQKSMKHLRDVGLVYNEQVRNSQSGHVIDNQLVVNYTPEAGFTGHRLDRNSAEPDSGKQGHLVIDQELVTNQLLEIDQTPCQPDGMTTKAASIWIMDQWNRVADETNANWQRVDDPEHTSDKRYRELAKAQTWIRKRLERQGKPNDWEAVQGWVNKYLLNLANDSFYAGHVKNDRYPTGCRWTVEQLFRNNLMVKAVEKITQEAA